MQNTQSGIEIFLFYLTRAHHNWSQVKGQGNRQSHFWDAHVQV